MRQTVAPEKIWELGLLCYFAHLKFTCYYNQGFIDILVEGDVLTTLTVVSTVLIIITVFSIKSTLSLIDTISMATMYSVNQPATYLPWLFW